jgi:hypothetical protein
VMDLAKVYCYISLEYLLLFLAGSPPCRYGRGTPINFFIHPLYFMNEKFHVRLTKVQYTLHFGSEMHS